ncbi:MAG: WecB/TagA/CpsF family glycosyltransferase [Bacillota bacterium]|nr:WecB/TagA/CpsF family glycosyltransferase [Bacillota bacterium]
MFSKILRYNVFNETKVELFRYLDQFQKVNIISGNPEVLYNGLYDESLFAKCNSENSLIIPDGIGVVLAAKLIKEPVKEKIAGIEVMDSIIKQCEKSEKSIYLVGAKQEILEQCLLNLHTKYSNLIIAGSHNGYFDLNNCQELIEDIKLKKPYAIFVAMGCPRQEYFINKYMDELPSKIYMGVGGSFDVIAGKVNRAPRWMINLGLEWLYRVAKEPFRIKRLGVIPKFLLKVIYNTYIIRKE